MRSVRVGTRGSKLALAQTETVASLIRSNSHLDVQVIPIITAGDAGRSQRSMQDGKAAFTREIDESLLKGDIDVAVHSMKDLPSELREGLSIAATPIRGDARDALVSQFNNDLQHLRESARIGTSSMRRRAQLLQLRPDLAIEDVHGNVETRLRKLESQGFDGIVLAAAGLERIGERSRISQFFGVDEIVPAAGQGIIAVEARKGDHHVIDILSKLDDRTTRYAATFERAFLAKIGGDCDVPIGANAEAVDGKIRAIGAIATPDGSRMIKRTIEGPVNESRVLGGRLAATILDSGGMTILEETRS